MRWLYRNLRQVRPAKLAVLLKDLFHIKRRVISTRSGYQFWADPVSHFGGEILETGIYEPTLHELLVTVLRPGDVFVDVGANEGYFSVLGSALVGGSGKVFSVEPQSRLAPIIRENLKLNGSDNVTLFSEALAEKAGRTTLFLTTDINSGATSFYKHWRLGAGKETVPTRSLDDFFLSQGLNRVRLIKLDCEGAELLIVRGARKVLSERRADFISVDFHPSIAGKSAAVEIDGALRQSGYMLSQAATGIWVYHLPGLADALLPLGVPKEIQPLVA